MIKSLMSLKTEVDKALKAMDRLDLVLTDMEWATFAGAAIILNRLRCHNEFKLSVLSVNFKGYSFHQNPATKSSNYDYYR
jgi:hypothetical protein